jgi:hypothetical protein
VLMPAREDVCKDEGVDSRRRARRCSGGTNKFLSSADEPTDRDGGADERCGRRDREVLMCGERESGEVMRGRAEAGEAVAGERAAGAEADASVRADTDIGAEMPTEMDRLGTEAQSAG